MIRHYLDALLERPLSRQLLFLAVLVLALAGLDHALVYRHQAGRIARIAAELDLVRLDEARLRAQLGRLPRLRKETATLRSALLSRLSRGTGPSTPLETLSARATMAGLEMIRFRPDAALAGEHFTEIPMEVEVRGTFHDLLAFFDLTAGSLDPLNATDLAIETLPGETGRPVLRITLEMAALRLPAEGTDADAESRAGADPATPSPVRSPTPVRVESEPPSRDPFEPYKPPAPPGPAPPARPEPAPDQPLEPDPVQRFHAVGIVWEKRAAVALVKEAAGFSHVVQPGARLGSRHYRVKAITPCEVVLEPIHNGPNSRQTLLKVPRCTAFESEGDGPPRRRDSP